VVAFSIEKKFISSDIFCDKPIIPFEDIDELFPKDKYFLFVAIGHAGLGPW